PSTTVIYTLPLHAALPIYSRLPFRPIITNSNPTPRRRPRMRPYLDLIRHVLDRGTRKRDRTGTGTLSVFGPQLRFDLARGFPLVDRKSTRLNSSHVKISYA